ncbi:MAG: LysR family transcriptional regulator [Oscillospiraceae bacterium]|nr:LysR family transcriptional regulator [Oscillospiraceae bacterium]
MTIQQVIYVLEAASCRNISQAAERLFVSQSAVSQQISRLERELGCSLFARSFHRLELTEEGERFCREARPVVEAWQTLCSSVRADNPTAKKQLRIEIGPRVYSNGLFQGILRFFDAHPEIEASFITESGRDYPAALRRQNIDLALDVLSPDEPLAADEDFYVCELIRERQCVLASPEDPRAAAPEIPFSELQGAAMISALEYSSEDRVLKETCRKYHVTFERVYRSDSINMVMSLVREGRGVVLGPRSFADYYHVAAIPLVPPVEASLCFICLRKLMHRRELPEFRDHLLTLCR